MKPLSQPLNSSESPSVGRPNPRAMASRWERIGAWLKKVENQKNLARFAGDTEHIEHAIGHWKDVGKYAQVHFDGYHLENH